jgi:hypothetical protein
VGFSPPTPRCINPRRKKQFFFEKKNQKTFLTPPTKKPLAQADDCPYG